MNDKSNDEIDLIELLLKLLRILKRNYVILIVAFCLGLGFVIYKYLKKETIYETRYVVAVQGYDFEHVVDIVNNLADLIQNNQIEASRQLNLSDTLIKKNSDS